MPTRSAAVGHNPLPWPQPAEQPDRRATAASRDASQRGSPVPDLRRTFVVRGGTDLRGERWPLASEGDALASNVLEVWYQRLARALATIVNVVDPDVIVAGGGLSRISGIYDRVPALWTEWVFSDRVDTALRPARHGDASGVRGAARLWPLDSAGAGRCLRDRAARNGARRRFRAISDRSLPRLRYDGCPAR